MPTYVSASRTFEEPRDWGNNYGSRIRGYFVPNQTGPHVFFIGITFANNKQLDYAVNRYDDDD